MGATPLPMFPLGTVLFPGALLPLHVFEPRYLTMMAEILAGDGRFGVVLIERGSAESPENVPTGLGTVGEIVSHDALPDGRMIVLAEGRDRISVEKWLDDDPYPRAMIHDVPEPALQGDLAPAIDRASRLWRRIQALAAELGHDVEIDAPQLSDDPTTAVWQLCAISPLGPFDRHRLLAIDDQHERLAALEEALGEVAGDLEARLVVG